MHSCPDYTHIIFSACTVAICKIMSSYGTLSSVCKLINPAYNFSSTIFVHAYAFFFARFSSFICTQH